MRACTCLQARQRRRWAERVANVHGFYCHSARHQQLCPLHASRRHRYARSSALGQGRAAAPPSSRSTVHHPPTAPPAALTASTSRPKCLYTRPAELRRVVSKPCPNFSVNSRWWWSSRSRGKSYSPAGRGREVRGLRRVQTGCGGLWLAPGFLWAPLVWRREFQPFGNASPLGMPVCRAVCSPWGARSSRVLPGAEPNPAPPAEEYPLPIPRAAAHRSPPTSITTSRSLRTSGSRVRTISASLKRGVCLSSQHPSASSQWNVPLCVPIFTMARFVPAARAAALMRRACPR